MTRDADRAWQEAPPKEFDSYYLVLMTTGEATDIDPRAKQEAFLGHQAHMLKCYRAGELLSPARVEQLDGVELRGILIYRGDLDPARVAEIVRQDPLVQIGAIQTRVTRMHTPKGIIDWR
jgi:hypothetical protein